MNVLHVTLSFAQGGRREAITRLAVGLAPLDVTARLCCIDSFESTAAERSGCFADSIELHRRGARDAAALRRLRDYCREHAIDVVHTHDAASQAASVYAMPFSGPPILMTFHRTLDFESARLRDRLRNALVCLRVDAIVAASESRRRHYLESNYVRADKVQRIALGIDQLRFRPDAERRTAKRAELGIADNELVVGTVGHFRAEKGVDLAIDAFQAFCERNPERRCRLIVLGKGEEKEEQFVRSRITAKYADRILLAGFQSRQEEWFPAFDLLLHGARSEAFGLALVEAMACGVPVVSTRVGGIPEVVADGETGLLAASPDASELADKMTRLVGTPGLLSTMGDASVARVRREFDRATYAARYLDLYRKLVARRHPRAESASAGSSATP